MLAQRPSSARHGCNAHACERWFVSSWAALGVRRRMPASMPTNLQPQVVLLPGMDGTEVFFRPFIEQVPSNVRVQAIDYACFDAASYDELAEQVLQRMPSDPFVLLGWSFSGPRRCGLPETWDPGSSDSFSWLRSRPVRSDTCLPG